MNLQVLVSIFFAAVVASSKETTDHDKIQPILQPEPVTISEKTAVKFKPQLHTGKTLCVSFPAVSDTGEVTGGLKGTKGNDACTYAPNGSQVYGRAGWYKNVWAIMYSWYFPKGFDLYGYPMRRHDWRSAVLWIDNPGVVEPKILGASLSSSDLEYGKELKILPRCFAGYRKLDPTHHRPYDGSNTSLRIASSYSYLSCAFDDGYYQDLIMWEQLTDSARGALNNNDNFGKAEVPFNNANYEKHLNLAWPF